MEEIDERYSRLSKIFSEENLDVKKAEQSLFLIETNLNNLTLRENEIAKRFLEYKDRYLQKDNLSALELFISKLNEPNQFTRLNQKNFNENSIDINILLFSQIRALLESIDQTEENLKFKEALIADLLKIVKNLTETEKSLKHFKSDPKSDINIQHLVKIENNMNNLIEDIDSLNAFLANTQVENHPFIESTQTKINEWNVVFGDLLNAQIKRIFRNDKETLHIDKEKLVAIIHEKSFFTGSPKAIETFVELISDINSSLLKLMRKDITLDINSQAKFISISKDEVFHEAQTDDVDTEQNEVTQIFSNFEIIVGTSQETQEIILQNTVLLALIPDLKKIFETFETNLILKLTELLFPFAKSKKNEILDFSSQIEQKYAIILQSLKDTCKNIDLIEAFRENEKQLLHWKDDFFIKIQNIQSNPDPKNNESFYRKVVEVVEKLKGYTNMYKKMTDSQLERKFIEFQITALKLIVLVIKIVDEEKTKKALQLQILNLKSASFVVIQDLILDLLSLIEEKKKNDEYHSELLILVRYFNAQEIDTWIDLKNLNLTST